MKINHIKDNLINETNVNVITTDDNENDYIYIKGLLMSYNSSIIGKDLDTNKEIKVKDKDIIYFETYGRDVCFTTIENKLLIIKISMKRLEEILSSRSYFKDFKKSIEEEYNQ